MEQVEHYFFGESRKDMRVYDQVLAVGQVVSFIQVFPKKPSGYLLVQMVSSLGTHDELSLILLFVRRVYARRYIS